MQNLNIDRVKMLAALDAINVFYHVDGVLQYGFCIPKVAHAGIVPRIKVMSNHIFLELNIITYRNITCHCFFIISHYNLIMKRKLQPLGVVNYSYLS